MPTNWQTNDIEPPRSHLRVVRFRVTIKPPIFITEEVGPAQNSNVSRLINKPGALSRQKADISGAGIPPLWLQCCCLSRSYTRYDEKK
jgi:hypothetical protein